MVIERCSCGAELLPELHFCVGCGSQRVPRGQTLLRPPAPARPSVRSSAPWIGASASIVAVAVLAAVAVLTLRPALVVGAPVAQSASVAPSSAPAPVLPMTSAPVVSAATVPSPSASATDLLTEQVDRDRATVEGVTGQWVPQLSSKRPGTVDGGISYDADAILSHYQGLAAAYPGAALLWSGDWPVFKRADYWVVIVAQPFSTAAGANAWCDARGFGTDDCLAKKLLHSGGPQGTTVPRT